ncbi:MAG TPA: transglycosylase domain-containing protein [Myxococcota bacterium]|nr:transglycosylase domain-containing protein [Myxococcota bacterium]
MPRKSGRRSSRKSAAPGIFAGLFAVGAVIFLLAAAAVVKLTEAGLPPVPTWEEYSASIPKVSRIRAADGTILAEIFSERRTVLDPESLPPLLVNAVLAAEDAGFMDHQGLSYVGIARAMLNNLWRGRISQGGSTITQQVVKQVSLSPERTFKRKFRELLLTRRFEIALTKRQILAMYMSTIYLGHGRYGFEEAARFYFGRKASELAVHEAAMLAGLISSPEGNSILKNPDGAVARQRHVLNRMAELGMITADQATAAAGTSLLVWGRDDPMLGTAPYFVDAVLRDLRALVGKDALDKGGLDVVTTLDLEVQAAVDKSIAEGLVRLYAAGRQRLADEAAANMVMNEETGERLPPPPRAIATRIESCRRGDRQAFVKVGDSRKVVANRTLARMGGTVDSQLDALCDNKAPIAVSKGVGEVESVRGKLEYVNAELGPQASMVVIDSRTRAVRAMTGGEDFETRRFNRAVQSRMPIGSTIKPFIFAAALAAGIPADKGWVNEPVAFRGHAGKLWKPRNYGGVYDGRTYDMTGALKDSINVVAVKILKDVGVDRVGELMESIGFSGSIPRDLSMALGSVEASPMELANAYAVFGSGGFHDAAWTVRRVTDFRGKVLAEHQSRSGRVLPADVATAMKVMMREVAVGGTAKALADLPGSVWGKTGTSSMSREAWFAGGFRELVAVVLVAYDDRLAMSGATGGNTAVPFFRSFAAAILGEGR